MGEWINTLGIDYRIIFFNNKNKLSSHEKTWRNLKYILIGERG